MGADRRGDASGRGPHQVRIVAGVEHEDSRYRDATLRRSVGITSVYGEAIVKPFDALTLTGGVRNDDHETFGNHTTFGADAALALRTGTTLRASEKKYGAAGERAGARRGKKAAACARHTPHGAHM